MSSSHPTHVRNAHCGLGKFRSAGTRAHSAVHSSDRAHGPVETIALSSLTHAISTPPGTKERLLIRVLNVKLIEYEGQDLMCSVSVRPASASHLPTTPLFKKECELHKGAMEVILEVGEAPLKEPWSVHLQFRTRARSFASQKIAEATASIPQVATRVALKSFAAFSGFSSNELGAATLEVLRLVPGSARERLVHVLCSEIEQQMKSRSTGIKPDSPANTAEDDKQSIELDRFCTSVKELCIGASARPSLESVGPRLLDSMASLDRLDVAEVLLMQGIEPTAATVHAAEGAGNSEMAHRLLERLRPIVAGTRAKDAGLQLVWALQQKLPGLADRILEHFPSTLQNLPCRPGSPAAKMAYEAGAFRVVAALAKRGDPLPVPVGELLAAALEAGHVSLAQVCLSKSKELDVDDVVRICLGHESSDGRQRHRAPTIMVREALEARWRAHSSQQKWCNPCCGGPASLALAHANGPQGDPAECGVCFEPLHSSCPTVFLNECGARSCPHFFCQSCAENLEAKKPDSLWDFDLFDLQPKSKLNCPMCRRTYSTTARLPDPTVDPCSFFQYACLPEAVASSDTSDKRREFLRLTEKAAYDALCAVLPVDPSSFKEEFTNTLWPTWTNGKQARTAGLTEAEFAAPSGMLSWVVDHLMELKVEQQLGEPPRLAHNPEAWFRHFDYDCDGLLSRNEVLRGMVKMAKVQMLADRATPSNQKRCDGVQQLRDLLDGIWNAPRWKHGVPMQEFLGREGLAAKLLSLLPEELRTPSRASSRSSMNSISIEEALAKARAADLADHKHSKEHKSKSIRKRPSLQSAAWGSQRESASDVDSLLHGINRDIMSITAI